MTEDIKFYLENKHFLLDKKWRLRRSGVYPRDQPFAGIENQGATCYLNSLIQCLFHLPIFRSTLFVNGNESDNRSDSISSHKDDLDVKIEQSSVLQSPILGQLQRLFAKLLYSKRPFVDTIDLLESFGWSKAERVEQHDVHEFFSVLLDAIGTESPQFGNKLSTIFAGFNNDHLVCNLCGFKSTRQASFMNISLDMPERTSATTEDDCSDIRPLFQKLLATETLDEDNKWFCESCKEKVIASKFSDFKSLPPVLVLQLKRFRYDPTLQRRVKVSTRITFPYILDADIAFKSNRTADKMGEEETSFGTYQLASFILHTGTAMGGHYRAYIRTETPTNQWRDFNDSTVSEIPVDSESPTWSIKSKFGSSTNSAANSAQEEALSCIDSYSLNTLVQENVYLLVYTKRSPETTANCGHNSDISRDTALIPSKLVEEIDEEQKSLELVQKLHEIRKNLMECEVYMPSASVGGFSKVLITYPKDKSVGELKEEAINAFIAQCGIIAPIPLDAQFSRLTKFDSLVSVSMGTMTGKKRQFESFGGEKSEALSLHTAGLRGDIVEQLFLDVRKEEDPPFVEFNPKDVVLQLYMYVSSPSSDPPSENGFSILYLLGKSPESTISCGTSDHLNNNVVSLGEVTLTGNDNATVADLRCLVLTLLSDAVAADRLLLIAVSESGPSSSRALPIILSADESSLKRHYHVFSGDKVIVEVIPAGVDTASFSSQAFKAIEDYQKRIRVFVNNPLKSQSRPSILDKDMEEENVVGSNEAEESKDSDFSKDLRYDIEVAVSLDDSLQLLKDKIAKLLNIPEDVAFHIRKSSNGTQLKDATQSLRELSFSDGSIAHVQLGAGCNAGEVMLHICLDNRSDALAVTTGDDDNVEPPQPIQRSQKASESRYTFVGQLPVGEKLTVLQLKQLLFHLLTGKQQSGASTASSSSEGCGWDNLGRSSLPASPHHLRLKDFPRGKLSAPLRDDRQLMKCLLGLSDGRKIAVQVLPKEEKIGANDIILAVRVMLSEHQPLLPAIDLPLSKKSSVQALAKVILDLFPQMRSGDDAETDTDRATTSASASASEPTLLSIAKGFSTGPPLTVKSALKLKWYQIASGPTEVADATMITGTIDEPPLVLRDGAVIVVRSTSSNTAASPPRTCATIQGDPSSSRAILPAAGAGATAVRAKNVLFRKGSTADNLRSKPWEVDAPRVPYKYNTADATTSFKIQRPPLRERAMKITSTATSAGTDNAAEAKEQQNFISEDTPTAESPLYDLPTPL